MAFILGAVGVGLFIFAKRAHLSAFEDSLIRLKEAASNLSHTVANIMERQYENTCPIDYTIYRFCSYFGHHFIVIDRIRGDGFSSRPQKVGELLNGITAAFTTEVLSVHKPLFQLFVGEAELISNMMDRSGVVRTYGEFLGKARHAKIVTQIMKNNTGLIELVRCPQDLDIDFLQVLRQISEWLYTFAGLNKDSTEYRDALRRLQVIHASLQALVRYLDPSNVKNHS